MHYKKYKIGLVTLSPFPIGNVSTVRYTSYLSALATRGVFTKVYIFAPSRSAKYNKTREGVYEGIHYEYLQDISWSKKPNLFKKIFYYLKGLCLTFNKLRVDKISHMILYHQNYLSYCLFWIFCRVYGVRLLTDKSEYPYGYTKMGCLKRRIATLFLKVFDGYIIMTKELMDFYSLHKSNKAKLFLLPMTISSNRFDNIVKKEHNRKYIAVVFGTHNRDGLFESIQAYEQYLKLEKKTPLSLYLIGNYQKIPNKQTIDNFIKDKDLASMICFTGVVPIGDVPQYLSDARVLLTTANEYSSGGFPTKIGEYMLSGVPIVATKVGELPLYLKDKYDVYFVEPRDYQNIALTIYNINQNYTAALRVADNAKKTALNYFNATTYVEDLKTFIESL